MPTLTRITDDMALRGTELPAEEEFDRASHRAESIFGTTRQPVRTARSVQAIAQDMQSKSSRWLAAAEELEAELSAHVKTLGLADDAPRMVTSRIITGLLARLSRGLRSDGCAARAGKRGPARGKIRSMPRT